MKSNSDERPLKFLDLGDGSYHYNYNIRQVEIEDENGVKRTGYEYDTVQIQGLPTYEKCVKAIIREEIDADKEFSIINKYNSLALGIKYDESAEEEYKAYLMRVSEIKMMVKADINNK